MAFICFSLVSLSTQISFILGYFFLDIRNLDYLLFCLIFSSFLFLFFPIYLSVYLSILYTDGPCFNCLTIAGRGEKKRKKGKRKKTQGPSSSYVCSSFIVLVEWDYFLFFSFFYPSHFSTSHKMHE